MRTREASADAPQVEHVHRIRLTNDDREIILTALTHELSSHWGKRRKIAMQELIDRLTDCRPGHR